MTRLTFASAVLTCALPVLPLQGQAAQRVLPYKESFDSAAVPSLPAGWSSSQYRLPGANDFTTTATTAHSAPNAVISTNATVAQALLSPMFDCTWNVPDRIEFYSRRSSSHGAAVILEASLDSGATFPLQLGDTLWNTGSTAYTMSSFPLPAALSASRTVVFRWRVLPATSGGTGTFRIDDVYIHARPAYDLALTGLHVSPRDPVEGMEASVAASVVNSGTRPMQGFSVNLFLDRNGDSLAHPSEFVTGERSPSAVDPGDSVTLTLPFASLSPFTGVLIGQLDDSLDQDAANNSRLVPLCVRWRPGSVPINEIQYAPGGTEPEWIELFNLRGDSINLKNWQVADAVSHIRHGVTTADRFVAPRGFMLLTNNGAALLDVHPEIPCGILTMPSFPTLNNTGDVVVIYDAGGSPMDSVSYLPAWGGVSGQSLERVDAEAGSCDSANWGSSVDSLCGTPGRRNSIVAEDQDLCIASVRPIGTARGRMLDPELLVRNAGKRLAGSFDVCLYDDRNNDSVFTADEAVAARHVDHLIPPRDSVRVVLEGGRAAPGHHRLLIAVDCPGDERPSNNTVVLSADVPFPEKTLVINEIMCAPLPDGAEYVEFLNVGGDTVDVEGWQVGETGSVNNASGRFALSSRPLLLPPGGFHVVASDSSIFREFPDLLRCEPGVVHVPRGSLGLNNDGDILVLKDPSCWLVDSVSYHASWHNPCVVDQRGRSLERMNPLGESNDTRNWGTCLRVEGGTPGRRNSIFTGSASSQRILAFSPNPFSPDGDGVDDHLLVHYELPVPSASVTIKIFDVRGRLIRTLLDNTPSGLRGDVIWDGCGGEYARARIGVYIVTLEALDGAAMVVAVSKGVVVLAGQL